MQRKVSIAPMMKCTDRHGRYLLRLISPSVDLYTEMINPGAILHGDPERLLAFDPIEHPIGLQLGGSDPAHLAQATRIACQWGYDEINLNVGCPSDRVRAGKFGACLFKTPALVAQCIAAMQEVATCPVTIKTRIGVDQHDSYDDLCHFVDTTYRAGCQVFIIHARKAWLKGLNPKENRTIPPLHYERVIALKKSFPELTIIVNGGIKTVEEVQKHLAVVDGVMIGREAYNNPFMLTAIETGVFKHTDLLSRREVLTQYRLYMERQLSKGVPVGKLIKPLLGLFHGIKEGRKQRHLLTVHRFNTAKLFDCLKAAAALGAVAHCD